MNRSQISSNGECTLVFVTYIERVVCLQLPRKLLALGRKVESPLYSSFSLKASASRNKKVNDSR